MKLMEEAAVIAAMNGADSIRQIDMAKALTKIRQVGRPFVSDPFLQKAFDLSSLLMKEHDAETEH